MSTLKSNNENMTINADGASSEVKFQANGVEKASISAAGAFTSTTIDATALTGNLPAIDGSSLTGVGKVLQVVKSAVTSTDSTSTSTSWVDSGLTINITPNASGNKIYVWSSGGVQITAGTGHTRIDYRLIESATSQELAGKRYIGVTGTAFQYNGAIDCSGLYTATGTSQITFKTQARKAGTTASEATSFASLGAGGTYNTLIAMEVEA